MENQQLQLVLVVFCGFLSALGSSQKIPKMAVRSDIRFRFATTEMTCVMTNDKDTASELTFDVTLPKDAFIANFSMEINGKSYPGDVKKKGEARQEYLAARRSGSSGGLVEQSARHSNKFDVSVNMAAQSNVTFTLIYQELLRRRFGSYEYSVYIDNKTLAQIKEYSLEIYIQDRNKIKDVRTPAMRKEVMSNDVEESQNVLTQISNPSETTVHVVYRPTPQDLKEQGSGWFVVQYDVDSDLAGELLVVDGYFVHFFMPPDDLPPMPLDIVFVLDISGSMAGHKMEQLKNAMRIILDDLRETDRFNILLFDGTVQPWEDSLQEASEFNISRAQAYVGQINYRGSTNLHLALMQGLQLLQGSREASRVPMMFFLTDGEATAGVQDSATIVADVSQKNEGVVNIYSLAFGTGADYKLLRQISTKNNGFARKIYEASDAAQQVSGLYQEISTIVMKGLTVSYHPTSNNDDGDDDNRPPLTIDNTTITICDLSVLYGRSDFVVAGKLENAESLVLEPEKAGGLKLEVSGLGAVQQINFVLEENNLSKLTLEGENPFWSVPRDLSKMAERAWAFLLIKQLLEEKVAALEDPDLVKDLDARILELSLKYHFVTPLTSMVVTRPEDGLKKNKSEAASFTAHDDVPAAKPSQHHQVAYSSRRRGHRRMRPALGSVQHNPLGSVQHNPVGVVASGPKRSWPASSQRWHHWLSSSAGGSVPRNPVGVASGHPEKSIISADTFGTAGPNGLLEQESVDPVFLLTRLPARATSTHRPKAPRPTSVPAGANRRGKGRKKKRGKGRRRKDKKCIRNKRVFLQSVLVHGSQTPASCYEVKASRSAAQSYTLFADPSANISVVVAMKRKFLLDLHIHKEDVDIQVSVTPKGELASSLQLPIQGDGAIQVIQGLVVIRVNVTKKTCKVSFVSIDIDVGGGDADPAVVREYTGIVAKAIQKAARPKRRRGRGKKKKVPKGCVASNIPADRAFLAKGKYLMRHRV